MERSSSGLLLFFVFAASLTLLAGPVSAAAQEPSVPVVVEVDPAPRFEDQRFTLGFGAVADENAIMNFQVGAAGPRSCAYDSLPERPPAPIRRMVRAMFVSGERTPPPFPLPPTGGGAILLSARGDEVAHHSVVTCFNAAEFAPGDRPMVVREPDVVMGKVFQRRVEAGMPMRLEGILDEALLRESHSPGEIDELRYFVRVWQEGSPDSVIVPAGSRYEPSSSNAPADGATQSATENATLALACMALASGSTVSKTGRWKDWHLPLPWPLVWLFSRLQRSKLLDHRARRLVHDLVEANPGIRFGDLRKRSALATGVLSHHLRMLEDHGLVVTVHDGRQRHLYAKGAPGRPSEAPLTQRQREILGLLATGEPTQAEIALRLGLTQQAVSYHVQKLKQAGRAAFS